MWNLNFFQRHRFIPDNKYAASILLVILGVVCQIHIGSCYRSDKPFNLPCTPRRTEISFPVVRDVTGSVSSRASSTSQSSHDLLYVTLKWRRRRVELVLYKNDVTSPVAYSEWSEGNETFAKSLDKTCFYHGYIRGQRSSYVALSTCDGLSGYIQTDEELLFIEPSPSKISQAKKSHLVYTCEPRRKVQDSEEDNFDYISSAHTIGRRRRSARRPKYLEVMVVVDRNVVDHIGSQDRAEDYVMALMNIANTVYQHHTLGMDIKVVVVKIIFLKKNQQKEVLKKLDAFTTVNMFCKWSQEQIPPGQPMDYDISVLITKEELGPSGYAPITGLCNPVRSCAAVRDEGFTTGFIIAHEMAHVFGLFHDGHGNSCHGDKYETSMMAALVESKLNHFWWSECSRRRMTEMIRYLFCLNNEPKPIKGHYPLEAPKKIEHKLGQPWSLDFQCKMEFGDYFRVCPAFYNDPCGILWCSHQSQPYLCRTKRGPPLPGSSCGHDRECRDEVCQYVGNMRPVHGNWGAWSPWTECSTECGVGVRQKARICDNPAPAYDGNDCEGEANIWETCANNTCDRYEDIRDGECDIWDSLQIRYGTHKWQPYEGRNASSLCKQTCKSLYTGEVLTIDVDTADGSPCSYTGNNSNICMAGKCLTVGCDGKVNSTKKEDMCGICDGDGSQCKLVRGTFIKKPTSGSDYVAGATIPSGARHIKIEESKNTPQFLALQNVRYGTIILNGDKRQSASQSLVIGAAMFTYKRYGPRNSESIESPGPLRTDLKLMVYPNDWMEKTSVSYSYIVHKSDFTQEMNKYKWKFEKWSDCSVTCGQGVQSIIHGCYDKDTNEKVDDELCSFLKAPRKDEVRCTREACGNIRYNFAMSIEFEECDAACGEEGLQVQKFHCERWFVHNNTQEKAEMRFCDSLEKPHITRVCKGKPCDTQEKFQWAVSDWSECPCGEDEGTQTRDVYCEWVITVTKGQQNAVVEKVDDDMCRDTPDKPQTSTTCQGKPCGPIFQWAEGGRYTECNAACGEEGTEEAILECEQVTITNGVQFFEIADDFFCEEIPKPEPGTEICYGEPCEDMPDNYHWEPTEEWTDCNAMCGQKGSQRRKYTCKEIMGGDSFTDVSDDKCDMTTRPDETRECDGPECKLKWAVEEWSACTVTCGKGKHYRKVYCGDPDTDLDDIKCTDHPPATSKTCEMKDCPEPRDEDCVDMYQFCSMYKALKFRCKRDNFRRKCCRTCMDAGRSARRPMNALEKYMKKRGLGRWRRRRNG